MGVIHRHLEASTPLLNADAGVEKWNAAAKALYDLYTELADPHGLEQQKEQRKSRLLGNGMAISPHLAGRCLLEGVRSARFLQAVERALEELRGRFETPRVLYAGCGPYAPLLLPIAARLPEGAVEITLLDIHPEGVASVKRLVEALKLDNHIAHIECRDAATYRVPMNEEPHLVVSETMMRALTSEPQAAITLNLAAQMHPEGLFIPERITIGGALALSHIEFSPSGQPDPDRIPLGPLFELDRYTPADAETELSLPEGCHPEHVLLYTTEIRLFGDIALREYETGLTTPMVYPLVGAPEPGRRLRFSYRYDHQPELVCEYP